MRVLFVFLSLLVAGIASAQMGGGTGGGGGIECVYIDSYRTVDASVGTDQGIPGGDGNGWQLSYAQGNAYGLPFGTTNAYAYAASHQTGVTSYTSLIQGHVTWTYQVRDYNQYDTYVTIEIHKSGVASGSVGETSGQAYASSDSGLSSGYCELNYPAYGTQDYYESGGPDVYYVNVYVSGTFGDSYKHGTLTINSDDLAAYANTQYTANASGSAEWEFMVASMVGH